MTRARVTIHWKRIRADVERLLASRDGLVLIGLATLVVVWWVWGALQPVAVIVDERSYLLQARIFASGQWAAAAPPMPEFFQQSHVLVTPTLASKYPPGHAFLLAIGSLLGAPMLVSLLLSGATGSLFYALARRLTNVWIALLAWLIWLGDPINLRFRPSYFSEITTGALWLAGWWALLEWRATGKRRWMVALAAACGFGAITRPLTMLVFAIPVGIVVLRDVVRRKTYRDLAVGVAVGVAFLSVIPLWSWRTTGDWRETPLAAYRRDYLPFDRLGFSVDSTRPARTLSPPEMGVYKPFLGGAKAHASDGWLVTAGERAAEFRRQEWGGVRVVLGLLAFAGLFVAGAGGWLAFATCALLFAAHLPYPTFAAWTLYYFEALPVLALLSAIGVRMFVRRVALAAAWRPPESWMARAPLAATLGLVALVMTSLVTNVNGWRATHVANARDDTAFLHLLEEVRGHRVVIFVRYAKRLSPHAPVVGGAPDLEQEPIWLVHDRGRVEDERLMALAPYRVPLVFDEVTGQLRMLRRSSARR